MHAFLLTKMPPRNICPLSNVAAKIDPGIIVRDINRTALLTSTPTREKRG